MVTINNIAKPDALLMARPIIIPTTQQALSTMYGDFSFLRGLIVKVTNARDAPIWSI